MEDKMKELPIFVRLLVSLEDTERLHRRLQKILAGRLDVDNYSVRKSPVHLTLCFHKDLPPAEYAEVVSRTYRPMQGQKVRLTVTGVAADHGCATYVAKRPEGIPVFPESKDCHLTMLLHKKQPVYSNALIKRLCDKGAHAGEVFEVLQTPLSVEATVDLVYSTRTR